MDGQTFDSKKRQLHDLTLEIHFLKERLKKYRESVNFVDETLTNQLVGAIDEMQLLLQTPTLVKADVDDATVELLLKPFRMEHQLFCSVCHVAIKAKVEKCKEHIREKTHQSHVQQDGLKVEGAVPGQQVAVAHMNGQVKAAVPKKKKKEKPAEPEVYPLTKRMKKFLVDSNFEELAVQMVQNGEMVRFSPSYAIICQDISAALRNEYPNVQVYPFGSRMTGLGNEGGDLDIFIDLNHTYNLPPKASYTQDLKTVKQLLKSSGYWAAIELIASARTPILRAMHVGQKIDCDLSFTNGLSDSNTKLIRFFLELQPVFRKLCLTVKLWAHRCALGVSSYVLTLMVIFYLQSHKLLPTVAELQSTIKPFLIGHWQANFDQRGGAGIEKTDDFRRHLIGFYEFYGKQFDLRRNVVCPFLGVGLEKVAFRYGQEEQLPTALLRYKTYMSTIDKDSADPIRDLLSYEKPLVCQDPFELIHNVSKGVTKITVAKFVNYCEATADIFKTKRSL